MFELSSFLFDKRFIGSIAAALGVLFAYVLRDWVAIEYRAFAVLAMAAVVFAIHFWGLLRPDEKFEQVYRPTMDFLCGQILNGVKSEWEREQSHGSDKTFPLRVFLFKNKCRFWLVPVHQWNVVSTHPDYHIRFFGVLRRPGLVGLVEKQGHAIFSLRDVNLLHGSPHPRGNQVLPMDSCEMPHSLRRITDHVVGIACLPLQSVKRGKTVYLCIDAIDESAVLTLWAIYDTLTSLEKGSKPVLEQMAMYNT